MEREAQRGPARPSQPASQPASQLAYPTGVATNGAGNLYIADTENHRIRVLTQFIDSGGERAPLLEEIRDLLGLR